MIRHAQALARRGFYVFPIAAGAKAPPLWSNWPERAAPAVPVDWPQGANVGIHGRGLIVLDVDPRNGGDDTALRYDLGDTPLPPTLEAATPSGGRHLFYSLPAGHPGVSNRAHALGPGVDVKSTRGYVLGAGSRTPVGEYRWVYDVPIADAPEWLLTLCGQQTGQMAEHKGAEIEDAPSGAMERAQQWLAAWEPAIEGCGGDEHTFKTAAFLRDLGLSSDQALELLSGDWNDRCRPPWTYTELGAKVFNAYQYASGAPGQRVLTPADFPDVPLATPEQHKKVARPRISRLADLAQEEDLGPGPLIDGLLQKGSYSQLFGAPGVGKTFVALDIGYHIASGEPWMGRKVAQGHVLYLAFEGKGGLVKRAKALAHHYQDPNVPLHFVDAQMNLRAPSGWQEMRALFSELDQKPTLIIVDTFAQALMGADENSAQDVGAFNHTIQAMIAATGACVLILHHPGKDSSKGPRGSSALFGASDTIIEITHGVLTPSKQKDIELGERIGFKLVPIMVGMRDEAPVTSCVVMPSAVATETGGRILTGNNQRGWQALCDLSPNNEPVSEETWRDACGAFLGKSVLSKRFFDIKRRLGSLIDIDEKGYITRKME